MTIPGIGKGTAERIQQFLETGHIDELDALQAKLPEELPALLGISGMGPKKVALVYRELSVEGFDDLKRVIASGELAKLPGLGVASVKRISEGIAFLESSGGRTPLGVALPIAEALAEQVCKLPGVHRVEIAGSLRRGQETIGDIDLLCEADDGEQVVKSFVELGDDNWPSIKRVLAAGKTKASVTIERGAAAGGKAGREVQVDLRVVPAESFGAAWQYFTGSKEHNVRLRERAVRSNLRLNEYGLFSADGEPSIAGRDEEGIYKKLDLPWIPPELREDSGEFEQSPSVSQSLRPSVPSLLVTVDDIRGDLHMHTTASDGKNSIEEMASVAKVMGYRFIAICDHSQSSTIANGLSIKRMEAQIVAVREANERVAGIEILVGTECDILPNGSLDYPDDLLAQTDWVVASVHSAMGSGGRAKLDPTERTLAAIENRWVSVIGHPTGRLINRRAAMEIDMAAVVKAASASKTMLEINASWRRLDLKDMHARQAIEAGVTLSINTDAHHVEQLSQMRYGVMTARRARARPQDVVNTMTVAALKKRIAAKRG